MKKIRLIIVLIYVITILLITFSTIIFVARVFKTGGDLYFQEPTKQEVNIPSTSEIDKTIDVLKKFKIIQ